MMTFFMKKWWKQEIQILVPRRAENRDYSWWNARNCRRITILWYFWLCSCFQRWILNNHYYSSFMKNSVIINPIVLWVSDPYSGHHLYGSNTSGFALYWRFVYNNWNCMFFQVFLINGCFYLFITIDCYVLLLILISLWSYRLVMVHMVQFTK